MKGVNSEVALLNIGYEDGEGPTQIIAKSTPAMPLPVATFQRWYEREINFYNEFSHSIDSKSEMGIPKCLYNNFKHLPEGDGHLILLEAQSADNQGNQLDGYQAGEAAVIVRALASFHSIFWGSELLHGLDWLPQTTVGLHNAQPVQNAFSQAWEMLQRKSDIPIHLTPLIDRAVETYPDLLKRICSDHSTLIHGDFRPDNLFLDRFTSEVTAIDWQFVSIASGVYDLAYFLTLSLSPNEYKANHQSLIDTYRVSLEKHGIPVMSAHEMADLYVTSVFLSFAVFAIGSAGGPTGRMSAVHGQALEQLMNALLDSPVVPSCF